MPDTVLLRLENVSKRFGAVQALTEVDFEVSAGEVVALVGDNGAGKSTLIKLISGIFKADSGRFEFDGAERTVTSPSDATHLGIATVYQDLALCDNLDVVANLYLGHERIRGTRLLDETDMERDASGLLQRLSVSIPSVRTPVASLSGGQRQSVAVAKATMGEPKLVILDEPTAALGVPQTRQVLALIRRLRESGLGVVVISHNLVDIFAVADRIIVLRLGRRVATFDAATSNADQVVAAMTGANVTEVVQVLGLPGERPTERGAGPTGTGSEGAPEPGGAPAGGLDGGLDGGPAGGTGSDGNAVVIEEPTGGEA